MSVNISQDDFEEMLNESEPVVVLGRRFDQGTILRKLDPASFAEAYNSYVDSVEEEMENE